ncbi:MAG: type IV pilus twitching motility protein PilT [Armatimonadetes bacterium]|nr:type IV pilus twitching motility protein PilT [Armatimonadota bacterium]
MDRWLREHPGAQAPVIIHLSVGSSDDGDPTEPAGRLTALATDAGGALLVNITVGNGETVIFPAAETAVADRRSRRLFTSSSPLSEALRERARVAGLVAAPDARACAFSVDVPALGQVLEAAAVPGFSRQWADIQEILGRAVRAGASDLHLTVGLPPMIRVRGSLRPLPYRRLMPEDTADLADQLMIPAHRQIFQARRQVDLPFSVPGLGRFRVNVYRQRGSAAIAVRALPHEIPSLDSLDLPPVIKKLCHLPRGLILVTGPTGQGKSTTMAAMIDEINSNRDVHIITIEDPIEYVYRHKRSIVNQRELGDDSTSFTEALRGALREDPDVIMVGEMRDLETIAAALTIAESGHLVLSTLHTVTAVHTVDRIIDVFPAAQQQQIRVQLSEVLQAAISQQLLPNRAAEARTKAPAVVPVLEPPPPPAAGRPKPESTLSRAGRVAAVEIMVATPAVRGVIREAKTHQLYSLIQTGGQFGMQTMDAALADLVRRGLITREDALARAVNQEELRRLLDRPRGSP